jgi:alpha-galactosidase
VVGATCSALAPPLVFAGLDPHARYRAEVVDIGATPHTVQDAAPPWLATGITLTGSALQATGLQMPLLAPGNAVVVSLIEVD